MANTGRGNGNRSTDTRPVALGGSELDIEGLATVLWVVIDTALLTLGYRFITASLAA